MYYAVKRGKKKGIYNSWEECEENVIGCSGAIFQKFDNYQDAHNFINEIVNFTNQTQEIASESAEHLLIDSYNQSQIPLNTIINVWVYGDPKSTPPKIGVYFDEKNTLVDIYEWANPVLKTRVGLAACIRAISIVGQKYKNVRILYIHTDTKYLSDTINKNLKWWYKNQNACKEANADLFKFLYRQVSKTKMKILAVTETDKNCPQIVRLKYIMEQKKIIKNIEDD